MASSRVGTFTSRVVRRLESGYTFWIPVLLFVSFLPLRMPFRARFLINWDAVNFALGTHLFSLEHHQPHPPGYIGYIAAGWLLNHLTGDANASLTLLSIVSGAAAPAGFFLLASRFMPRAYALASAVLFGLSPVVWYYSGVALTYSVELGLALFILWAGYVGRREHSARHMLVATVLLVVLGAMRPSGALFLMPVWLYLVWALPWRSRLSAGAVLVGGNLAWLVPLMWLSGGVASFLQVSADLANLVVVPTSVFTSAAPGPGQAQNIAFVLLGLLVGVNFALLLIATGFLANVRAFAVFIRQRAFFFLWLTPAVLTYVLLHTGQLGYVLLILPAFFLLAGVALTGIARRWQGGAARVMPKGGGRLRPRFAVAGIVAFLAVGNVATFLVVPQALQTIAQGEDRTGIFVGELLAAGPLHQLTANLQRAGIGANPRQFNLGMSDEYWRDLIDFVRQYEPDRSAVLTAPSGLGSFRHLMYYLPNYRVYALGRDLQGDFGHLFTAYAGTSDYAVDGLQKAGKALQLPAKVGWLVVPDREIQRRLGNLPTTEVELESGLKVVVVRVLPGATLVVDHTEDNAPITLVNTLSKVE